MVLLPIDDFLSLRITEPEGSTRRCDSLTRCYCTVILSSVVTLHLEAGKAKWLLENTIIPQANRLHLLITMWEIRFKYPSQFHLVADLSTGSTVHEH